MRSARRIAIVSFAPLEADRLRALASALEEAFLHACTIAAPRADSGMTRVPSLALAEALTESARDGDPGELRLGVFEVDLFDATGAVRLGGSRFGRGIAAVSIGRLRPERYGERAPEAIAAGRLLIAATHHLGRALGRSVCDDPRCVRFEARSIYDLDAQHPHVCLRCERDAA